MSITNMKAIQEYPDVSFIDNYTIDRLESEMLQWFKDKKKELTGIEEVLAPADDRRIILLAGAYYIFQAYMMTDQAGKMGLLKYSKGDYLENLGALKHEYRNEVAAATSTFRFAMESTRQSATGIPAGTRLTAGDGVYFITDEYDEIPAGELYVDISGTCTVAGSIGNNYDIGDINIVTDPVPYIDSVTNISKPENGADVETDESLREKIYMAPSAYSCAGPKGAYEYYARKHNPDILDVSIVSNSACELDIRYILKDGEIPGGESLYEMRDYLMQESIRPLTDLVHVYAPTQVDYELNIKYFINESDRSRAEQIQKDVTNAIGAYKSWQRSAMGRDINPDMLMNLIVAAGAKRAEITSPVFTVIPYDSVAKLTTETITYGGLEDD